ncbi:MAG: MauE/DoxX family redox-associated membrane protein [Nocardioides sp.]
MDHVSVAALIVVLTLTAVLVTSGVAKLRDRRATRDAFDALRVPGVVPADAAAVALPWGELALGVLLLVAPGGWLVPVAIALLLLMLSYTWLIARALRFDEPVTCSCFGSLGRHDVEASTLVRNLLLSGLALAVLWLAVAGGSVPEAVGDLDAGDWWTLLAVVAAVAVAVLVIGTAPTGNGIPDGEFLEYDRRPVPYGSLIHPDGATATLTELARTQARLLVILNAHCGPCLRTAEKLDEWAERLSPSVGVLAVYPHAEAATSSTGHSEGMGVWEPELNVRRMFSVTAPAAVLLGADGFLAGGPVLGEDAVEELVAAVLDELAPQQTTG